MKDARIVRREQDALTAARDDLDSVIELTRDLVRIPSRGGIDSYEPVLNHLSAWMSTHNLTPTRLHDASGTVVALTCEVRGAHAGPRWVLDACLDTASFGDETAWTQPPTSGTIADGWLWGRGSADSKAGVAIFCHLAARLAATQSDLHGTLVLLFDVDEHTGNFGGAKRYFEGPNAPTDVAGVMIGYPGIDELVIGGRGVHRAKLHVHGIASHSGARKTTPNAIEKAAHLIRALSTTNLPDHTQTDEFPLPGKLTVTAIEGGQGYSVTPDLCTLNIDIRTTPTFDSPAADQLLHHFATRVDASWPHTRPTTIEPNARWPAYALPDDSPLRSTITDAAKTLDLELTTKVAGPSNIGNYLAGLNIPATAGFGVDYIGIHATDERIRLNSIPTVQAVYHAAALKLLVRQA